MTRFPLFRPFFAVLALVCLASASSAFAVVYIVPSDESLIRAADSIVHGRVVFTQPMFADDGTIVTETTIEAVDVLKGRRDARIVIRDPGGIVGTQAMGISGWTGYEVGDEVLVFLERNEDHLRTWGLALGKFKAMKDSEGRDIFRRGVEGDEVVGWNPSGTPHTERARRAAPFLRYIRSVVGGVEGRSPVVYTQTIEETASTGLRQETTAHYPPSAYTQGAFRWTRFDEGQSVTFLVSGSQPGYDSTGAAQRGLAAWTNEPNSNVVYLYGGTTSARFVQDNINAIVYNSNTDVPSGAIGYARWWANAQHTYKGELFYSISEGDVVMKAGISIPQRAFDEAVTHELGHTLGFRHSNEGTPSTNAAVMNSTVSGNYGASLAPYDVDAVTHVYTGTAPPPPPPCAAPAVTSQSPSQTITAGQALTLSVTVSGTTPITYQWYVGTPSSATPIPNSNAPQLTTNPTATTSYFVRASNACGSVDSGVITLSVITAGRRVRSDFDGDGIADIWWRNKSTGQNTIWFMNGTTVRDRQSPPTFGDANVVIEAVGDFDGDKKSDVMWHDYNTGAITVWLMDRHLVKASRVVADVLLAETKIGGAGDFNGDARDDVVWRNDVTGRNQAWLMNGTTFSAFELPALLGSNFDIEEVGDFNGDGRADVLWRNWSNGLIFTWIMNGATVQSQATITTVTNSNTVVEGVGDTNGDGREDIVWRNYSTGNNQLWLMNGATVQQFVQLPAGTNLNWRIVGVTDFNGDGSADLLWRGFDTGQNAIWFIRGASVTSQQALETVGDLNVVVAAPL